MNATPTPDAPQGSLHDVAQEELHPPLEEGRTRLDAPVRKVTLLEDRAQVERVAEVSLPQGRAKLVILGVSPVLQDVSLRVESARARVVDARVRRVIRIRRHEKPEGVAALEARLEALQDQFQEHAEDRRRLEERRATVFLMLEQGLHELPEDAAWGLVAKAPWQDTLEGLMARSGELDEKAFALHAEQEDLQGEIRRLAAQRSATDRPDSHLLAALLIDLEVPEAGVVDVRVAYVAPNALWRPLHTARLRQDDAGHHLEIRTLAAVWQNTGEDWSDVELWLSTARASLGTDPPLLHDDLLSAQKRSDEVVIQRREVAVQRATVKGGGGSAETQVAANGPVDLPGVDDGGEIRNLKSERPATVPSDGRPNLVPIARLDGPAEADLYCAAELDEKVFVRCRAMHPGTSPLLAGPVELIRDHGAVGFSKLLYVAPQERFELGFGPDDSFRVTRREQAERTVDHVDGWQHKVTTVQLFVSNLGDQTREIEVVERIPVSEIEHVRIALLEESTNPLPTIDDDGFCRWRLSCHARGHLRMRLTYRVSTAPGVRPV